MTWAENAGPSGWAWLVMAVGVLLFAGLSVGAYLLLFRGNGGRPARRSTAERLLAGQFARGQISEQEYLHLRAALDAAAADRRSRIQQPRGSAGPRSPSQ